MTLADIPLRLATDASILNSGLDKQRCDTGLRLGSKPKLGA
jgi:hypothetical protein